MQFDPPSFNLLANGWACANTPNIGAPDYTGLRCQKYVNPKLVLDATPPSVAGFWENWQPPIAIRVDRTQVPFNQSWPLWTISIVECPAGSAQYYRTSMCEIMHEGFSNEYGLIMMVQCDADGLGVTPPGYDIDTGAGASACP